MILELERGEEAQGTHVERHDGRHVVLERGGITFISWTICGEREKVDSGREEVEKNARFSLFKLLILKELSNAQLIEQHNNPLCHRKRTFFFRE